MEGKIDRWRERYKEGQIDVMIDRWKERKKEGYIDVMLDI